MIIVGGVLLLAGCKEKPQATNATLDVAYVQGSSFDEPARVTSATADATVPAVGEVMATPAPVNVVGTPTAAAVAAEPFAVVGGAQDTLITSGIMTAEQLPADISKIPNETPIPVDITPVPAPAVAVAPPAPVNAGEFQDISFNVLSAYKYEEPIPQEGEKPEDVEKRRQADQIPADVKALNGKKAVVQGWMVPMEVSEDGSVKSFVLVKTQPQCCFGDMQAMNEWIDVVMLPGQNAQFNVDLPVKVYGQLEVGEKTQDGFVLSIYRMQGQRVDI